MNIVTGPIISAIMLVIYSVMLFRLNVLFSIITLFTFPMPALVIGLYHQYFVSKSFKYRNVFGRLYNRLLEMFRALKLIKAMRFEKRVRNYAQYFS